MAIGTGLAIAGGLLGAVGSKRQGDAQSDAANAAARAAEFNPFNVRGSGGQSIVNGQNIDIRLDDQQQNIRNLLGQLGLQGLGGQGPNAGFSDQLRSLGGGALPGLFGQALNTQDPSLGQFGQQLNPLISQAGQGGAFGLGQAGPQNQQLIQQLLGQAGGLQQGALGQLGQGSGNQFLNQAGGLFNQGAQLAGQAPFDPSQLVNDRLSLLRQQAAPQEESQFNSLQNRLFSQGRLGSTGGSNDIEAFARGLGQADLGRQLSAQNLGLQAQQQSAGILGQQAGLFGQLGGQTAALGQGLGQQDISRAGLLGNLSQGLFGQAQGFGGQDISRLGTGLQGAQGLLGLSGNLSGSLFQGQFGVNDATNQRAQQRLSNAQGIFGFGQGLATDDFNRSLASLQGLQSIDAAGRAQAQLGLSAGQAQAQAGGNVAQALLTNTASPTGSFLGAFGTGLLGRA